MSETKKKKQRIDNGIDDDVVASFTSLSTDILANIFGHLPKKEILRVRRVCKKTVDAVKATAVPLESDWFRLFKIDSIKTYNALVVMAEVLPGLQQFGICSPSYASKYEGGGDFRYNDGEDSIESTAAADGVTILNLDDVLSKFPNLHSLDIGGAPLNGRYPSLFNFSHLERLSIEGCKRIKFDFEMLAGLPCLKEFECESNALVTGSLKGLNVCKDTLERIKLDDGEVPFSGELMDLADFPRLKSLDLFYAKGISGSLLDIDADNDDHFPSLEKLRLPDTLVGGFYYEVMHIADAKQLIKDLLPLRRKRPSLFKGDSSTKEIWWQLSRQSPDILNPNQNPEFQFRTYAFFFVEAGQEGQYLGWRWEERFDYTPNHPFEVTWYGHVPSSVTKDFVPSGLGRFYKGFYEPPPYIVYSRLAKSYTPCAEELAIWESL